MEGEGRGRIGEEIRVGERRGEEEGEGRRRERGGEEEGEEERGRGYILTVGGG